jgi:hypothetical protein
MVERISGMFLDDLALGIVIINQEGGGEEGAGTGSTCSEYINERYYPFHTAFSAFI